MRIDKYLWCVRLSKTRSLATELVNKGKVKLNGEPVKPAKEVKCGDVIYISKNASIFSYKILEMLENRVGAKLVNTYIIDITPLEEIEKYKLYQESQRVYRDYGTGKPSKKDRRDLGDFLNDWQED